jgi:hypothetical protein
MSLVTRRNAAGVSYIWQCAPKPSCRTHFREASVVLCAKPFRISARPSSPNRLQLMQLRIRNAQRAGMMSNDQAKIATTRKNRTTHAAILFTTIKPWHKSYFKCLRLVLVANHSASVAAPASGMRQSNILLVTSRCNVQANKYPEYTTLTPEMSAGCYACLKPWIIVAQPWSK